MMSARPSRIHQIQVDYSKTQFCLQKPFKIHFLNPRKHKNVFFTMPVSANELSEYLEKLSDCEVQMADAEQECEIYHAKKTQDIFKKRREITQKIPQFWYIVLAQCEDFAEYVRPEDLKYMEQITDIYVHRDVVDSQASHYRDYSITFLFQKGENAGENAGVQASDVPLQSVTKKFSFEKKDGKDVMFSEAVEFAWPAELSEICPAEIRKQKNGEYTPEQRKLYRQGMRSFFAFFEWTGRKPGKEFRGGEDLALLIAEEVFPSAVNLYVEAMNSEEDSEVDSLEGEELDVSEDEENESENENESEEPELKRQKK
ncbi:Nucleosome assembly protein NAP [Metschnikowia aff. pulcherrima]|uniref:Nucleosome assembly protein NAP n=1 Tax=Metschnikowia aff. pulcherrima TaxID=2163413 RepID=A0A4P6XXH6_9ASCO|nr:Nucleosome assembly protein NAP [Metschnikowia aff. pulcherrima]